jgi:SAM-dependent methyltransferase
MSDTGTFDDFLKFERKVFGDEYPIASYDPFLIRYGEYDFLLDMLNWRPGDVLLDLGCEASVVTLYLAAMGCRAIGVDIEPKNEDRFMERKRRVERATRKKVDLIFRLDDATNVTLEPESVDCAIAVSSIEHMFSKHDWGDKLAVESIAKTLKPGGRAVITLPLNRDLPFAEYPGGSPNLSYPYRMYNLESLHERILSNPRLEIVDINYLMYRMPDSRFLPHTFENFWQAAITPAERARWHGAGYWLTALFNPRVSRAEGEEPGAYPNTSLICLRKKGV